MSENDENKLMFAGLAIATAAMWWAFVRVLYWMCG
jgi:hypothetical protein